MVPRYSVQYNDINSRSAQRFVVRSPLRSSLWLRNSLLFAGSGLLSDLSCHSLLLFSQAVNNSLDLHPSHQTSHSPLPPGLPHFLLSLNHPDTHLNMSWTSAALLALLLLALSCESDAGHRIIRSISGADPERTLLLLVFHEEESTEA